MQQGDGHPARTAAEPGIALATEPAAAPVSGQALRTAELIILTLIFIGLCVLLSVPMLPAITWGVALTIIAWPLHGWVSRHVANPSLAAAMTSAVVVVMILGPGMFVVYELGVEAASAAAHIQDQPAETMVRDSLARIPGLAGVVDWIDRFNVDLETEIRNLVAKYTSDATGLIGGSVTAVLQFLVAVFILYNLLRDHKLFMQGVRNLLPLSQAEGDHVFARAADSVYANLYATVVTSLIDAVGGATMFWLLGLPSPVLWGVIIFVLSVLPVVGSAIVWGPAAAFLALTGNWLAAVALVAWGIVTWMIVDNILYVRLAGDRMRMNQVPALISFLGGLAIFGLSGMILGPAILAVTVGLLEIWHQRNAAARRAHDSGASYKANSQAVG